MGVSKSETFGIVHNLPFEKYQQLPGLNQTTLKQWLSASPLQHDSYKNLQALQFGSAGHCLLLEPDKFEDLYVRAPNGLKQRGKLGKKHWSELREQHSGKVVLLANEWQRLENIRKVFQIHPQIQKIWTGGNSEVSLFWQDIEYRLDCKARLDWFDPDSRKIIDLKFTNNIEKNSTQKMIQNFYAVQAAWYCRGIYQLAKITADFLLIFIEKYAPHKIILYSVSQENLDSGQQKIEFAIKKIHKAQVNEQSTPP